MSEIMREAMRDANRFTWVIENIGSEIWSTWLGLKGDVTHDDICRAIDARIEAEAQRTTASAARR